MPPAGVEAGGSAAPPDPRRLKQALSPYARPLRARAVFELLITALPFLVLWAAALVVAQHSFWLSLPLSLLAAAFLVRLFMIQHDCGHGSFFPRRAANDALGHVIGVFTFTPYGYWRRTHARHHATSGNLDHRGVGDINTLTVAEYRSRSRWRRFLYRLYRNPAVLLGVGPAYIFVLRHRLPLELMGEIKDGWISVMATNLAILAIGVGVSLVAGVGSMLAVQVPLLLAAATVGVWLFYVQHQFPDTHWERDARWNFYRHALHGSSHYKLPQPLRWFTANIGMHHIHHLKSRIPSYRLNECLKRHPWLDELSRITLRDSLRCARLALWDEERQKLVRFADVAR